MKDRRQAQPHSELGESWGIAMALAERPLTREEIKEQHHALFRRFGYLGDVRFGRDHYGRDFDLWLEQHLEALKDRGWVIQEGPRFALTEEGRRKARRALAETRLARQRIEAVASPQNVSKITLIVHLVLAALKLPAALLSGSVGLLNDAIDTLLDGASSVMVCWGLRRDREALVSRLLVVFMLGTGLFTLFEAVMRIVHREPVQVEGFTFVATLVSAGVCALLWLLQRFVGLRRGSLALITQSVDSRNHVIVAGGVTAGLVAAALRFPWLDYAVGLAVAVLILKSAVELAVELIRARDQEVALDKFQFRLYERFRSSQLCGYMLYLVKVGQAGSREELMAAVDRAFDFRDNTLLRTVGLDRRPSGSGKLAETCYKRLLDRDLLRDNGSLVITEAGRRNLAANRFFVHGEAREELKRTARLGLRIGLALIVRWVVFAGLFWLGTRYVLPRLPEFPLWDSLDRAIITLRGLELSLFQLLHLGAGLALISWATVRRSLIRSRHFAWRERRGQGPAQLISDGFFARVRHPLAGAACLYYLGLFFAFCSAWALVPLAFAAAAAFLATRAEERKDLQPRFGPAYRSYKGRVRRRLFTPLQTAVVAAMYGAVAAGLVL
ncbi:MAG: cation transporter [Spirochaetales bacterium]|nr:cation transporter [Spirochaetales bacterium]